MTELVEYDVYLPPTDQDVLARVRRDIIDYFGGLTDSRHQQDGVWRAGVVEIRDEIVVWRVLSDRGTDGDRFMREMRTRLERELAQKQILLICRWVEVL